MCGFFEIWAKKYDFQEDTLVFAAPGQVIGNDDTGDAFQPQGWWLTFQPELLHGTPLGKCIQDYHFFSYAVNEALHISNEERRIILDCLMRMDDEIKKRDKHSELIISSTIELLLNYCTRFYDRQFAIRQKENKDVLERFEHLLNGYFSSDTPQKFGTPSVKYCADTLGLSPNYFEDLIKKETGKTAQDHIQLKIMDMAKKLLVGSTKTVNEIGYELGYQYPQYFNRVFKNMVGYTPKEYRHQLM